MKGNYVWYNSKCSCVVSVHMSLMGDHEVLVCLRSYMVLCTLDFALIVVEIIKCVVLSQYGSSIFVGKTSLLDMIWNTSSMISFYPYTINGAMIVKTCGKNFSTQRIPFCCMLQSCMVCSIFSINFCTFFHFVQALNLILIYSRFIFVMIAHIIFTWATYSL